MSREIDEAWIDEAIERHRRIETLRADFDKAAASTQVTVGSPDGSVEVVVTAAGEIVDVRVRGSLQHRAGPELAKEIQAAVTAAADAARWARRKLHDEVFSEYSALGGR